MYIYQPKVFYIWIYVYKWYCKQKKKKKWSKKTFRKKKKSHWWCSSKYNIGTLLYNLKQDMQLWFVCLLIAYRMWMPVFSHHTLPRWWTGDLSEMFPTFMLWQLRSAPTLPVTDLHPSIGWVIPFSWANKHAHDDAKNIHVGSSVGVLEKWSFMFKFWVKHLDGSNWWRLIASIISTWNSKTIYDIMTCLVFLPLQLLRLILRHEAKGGITPRDDISAPDPACPVPTPSQICWWTLRNFHHRDCDEDIVLV